MRGVLCGLVVVFVGFSLACGFAGKKGTEPAKQEAKKTYTRGEFRQLLVGKTPDEVIAAVGKPDGTKEGGMTIWIYDNVTVDPITGKTDYIAQVWFNRGRVESVNY